MGTENIIPLTQGKVTLVDAENYELISEYKWRYSTTGYAVRGIRVGGKFTLVWMHRVITSAPDGMDVDHINGDGLDNRRANLRIATHAQNCCNQKLSKNNTTGYKGVSFYKMLGRFAAKIEVSGKRKHLGCFDTAKEAASAYDRAAVEYFGDFARLNFEGAL